VVDYLQRSVGQAMAADVRIRVAEGPGGGDVRPPPQADSAASLAEHTQTVGPNQLTVDLFSHHGTFGTLTASRSEDAPFQDEDVMVLHVLAAQASLLLHFGLLHDEVAAGAVLKERSRLAREIHDGIAQHLVFLKMRVAWLKRSHTMQPDDLEDIEGVLETALTEARHAISSLRGSSRTVPTSEAIVSYVEEFAQISGLDVDLRNEEGVPDVGPLGTAELLRIVQEALNNVRKHGRALKVSIILTGRSGGAEVRIQDNGVGFTPADQSSGHFGLDIMREEAQSVGGHLDVRSQAGRGTDVRVWIPARDLSALDQS